MAAPGGALLLTVLTVAVVEQPASAAPCPYNASADLDSLLRQSQVVYADSEDRNSGCTQRQNSYTYTACNVFYEGDIFLNGMKPWADPDRQPENMTPAVKLWPGGIVYYSTVGLLDPNVLKQLNNSIAAIERRTATLAGPCVRFQPWSPGLSEDFLNITDGLSQNCSFSSIGRQGGSQSLNLGQGSGKQEIKHLLMHALGFWHENNRPGRNISIEVLWDNVQNGTQCFFSEYRDEPSFQEEAPYSLYSATHVSLNAWASAGCNNTLRPRFGYNESADNIGFRSQLSDEDVYRIQTKYNCSLPICKGQQNDQMLPYPEDCHKFYQCDAGIAYLKCCPAALVFSFDKQGCEYDSVVHCNTPDVSSDCPTS